MLLLYASGAVTELIDVFTELINKEYILHFNSGIYIWSNSEVDIRVETIHSKLSRYGNIKAFHC